jgi:hypothetical protein
VKRQVTVIPPPLGAGVGVGVGVGVGAGDGDGGGVGTGVLVGPPAGGAAPVGCGAAASAAPAPSATPADASAAATAAMNHFVLRLVIACLLAGATPGSYRPFDRFSATAPCTNALKALAFGVSPSRMRGACCPPGWN